MKEGEDSSEPQVRIDWIRTDGFAHETSCAVKRSPQRMSMNIEDGKKAQEGNGSDKNIQKGHRRKKGPSDHEAKNLVARAN